MFDYLHHATVLITGASGLIGQNLIRYIRKQAPTCQIIAVVHNMEKAKKTFPDADGLTLIEADINVPLFVDGKIDYIIHGASITSSRMFVDAPVETILTSVNGTRNMLELAREKQVRSFLFLSTMEIYGTPQTDGKITEDAVCSIDTMQKRSSYPESKRLCETLCSAYHAQYGVPAKVIRLTQTIGPGIDYNDGRVFAEFARCVIEHRNIVLHTTGETKRSYLSTDDAVTAILTVLLKGENGQAYNAANEATYCSIYEMAQLVAQEICGGMIDVRIQEANIERFGYAPELKMNLDTSRLKALRWEAKDSLIEMYRKLITAMSLRG